MSSATTTLNQFGNWLRIIFYQVLKAAVEIGNCGGVHVDAEAVVERVAKSSLAFLSVFFDHGPRR